MEYKELNKKSQKELHKLLNETRDKLRDYKFKDANKQLKDIRIIRKNRKMISRILTSLNMHNKSGNKENKENKEAGDKEAVKENEVKDVNSEQK